MQFNIVGVQLSLSYPVIILFIHSFIHFRQALLWVQRDKRRRQSPEWTILSHNDCFIQGEVVGFQVLLDSLRSRSTRVSWWSRPVLRGRRLLRSSRHLSSGVCAKLPNLLYLLVCRAAKNTGRSLNVQVVLCFLGTHSQPTSNRLRTLTPWWVQCSYVIEWVSEWVSE